VGLLRWAVVVLSLVQGGFMAVDGTRALVVGSYITPRSGEHAGQLGPWTRLVRAVGIQPESTGMKLIFVVFGLAWLVTGAGVVLQAGWAWPVGIALSLGTLWYLVPGTFVSLVVLVLLLTPPVHRALTG
jgi:hypothetical protein